MAECVYCGTSDPRTNDHVPPKCLFPKPRPHNLITVPCCEGCREGTSLDDEYFRDMLVMRARLARQPDAQQLLPKVLRSLRRPEKQGFVHSIAETARLQVLETEAGLYLGKAGTYHVDLNRLENVVDRTIRGLYWEETDGERLHSDTAVSAYALEGFKDLDQEQAKSLVHLLELAVKGDQDRSIGEGAFRYRAGFAQDRPRTSVWILTFYQTVHFLGVTVDGEG